MIRCHRRTTFGVIVFTALWLAACGPGKSPVGQAPVAVLTDSTLHDVYDRFNAGERAIRVILLLSPT